MICCLNWVFDLTMGEVVLAGPSSLVSISSLSPWSPDNLIVCDAIKKVCDAIKKSSSVRFKKRSVTTVSRETDERVAAIVPLAGAAASMCRIANGTSIARSKSNCRRLQRNNSKRRNCSQWMEYANGVDE